MLRAECWHDEVEHALFTIVMEDQTHLSVFGGCHVSFNVLLGDDSSLAAGPYLLLFAKRVT